MSPSIEVSFKRMVNGNVVFSSTLEVMWKVNCSDLAGESKRGRRGSSMFRSFPSLGKLSNWNLAVNQLSVSVVTLILTAQFTPENNYKINDSTST